MCRIMIFMVFNTHTRNRVLFSFVVLFITASEYDNEQFWFGFDTFVVVLVTIVQIESFIIQYIIVNGYSSLLNKLVKTNNKYLL